MLPRSTLSLSISCDFAHAKHVATNKPIYLAVEGVLVITASLRLRTTPGLGWTLFNGIAALAPGILVYLGWPSSSFSVLGFFFGINLVLKGAAQFPLRVSPRNGTAVA